MRTHVHHPKFQVLSIDNTAVRTSQVARLKATKAARNDEEVQAALAALTKAAADVKGGVSAPNLLDLAVKAARARATLGEISAALESEWGRHVASTQVVQGAYSAAFNKSEAQDEAEYKAVLKEVADFAEKEGRRPRILVAKMGQVSEIIVIHSGNDNL
jgi:methylmalonyl-CoA mutase